MSSLWLSLEPHSQEILLSLSTATAGTLLRGRLPLAPAQPRALSLFLEALVEWFGQPLCAVLDADAEDVRRRPEFWARFLGELDDRRVYVEWVTLPAPANRRDRFLGELGRARRARSLVTFAAAGLR
jgi:hypothetical protein